MQRLWLYCSKAKAPACTRHDEQARGSILELSPSEEEKEEEDEEEDEQATASGPGAPQATHKVAAGVLINVPAQPQRERQWNIATRSNLERDNGKTVPRTNMHSASGARAGN